MKEDFIMTVALDYYYTCVEELCNTFAIIISIVCELRDITPPLKCIKIKISTDC